MARGSTTCALTVSQLALEQLLEPSVTCAVQRMCSPTPLPCAM